MVTKEDIRHNLEQIRQRIVRACEKSGRTPEEIALIAVSKTFSAEVVRQAYEAGLRHFGENKVQEVLPKMEQLADLDITWHFIGHLQTNKVKYITGKFETIQSVDSFKLASELQKRCEKTDTYQNVLVEVNCSGEETKFGIEPERALEFMEQLTTLDRLKIKGCMTIGKYTDDEDEIRSGFQLLRRIFEEAKKIKAENFDLTYLSMGMTDDFHIAIEEGANMIRIGRGIFGPRYYG